MTDPEVFAAYGYNTINALPNVSFGGSGAGIRITFNNTMIMAGSARAYS